MRTRMAGVSIIRVTFVLVAVVAGGACSSNSPTPVNPAAPTADATSASATPSETPTPPAAPTPPPTPPAAPTPASIEGVYNLTFVAVPSCALPAEFMRRTYQARITETADNLLVELSGPGFPEDFRYFYPYGFTGKRDGSAVRFDLHGDPCSLDPLCWDHEYLFREFPDGICSMGESCGPRRFVGYSGTATGTVGERSIPMVFRGTVRLWGAQNAACTGDHRLDLLR